MSARALSLFQPCRIRFGEYSQTINRFTFQHYFFRCLLLFILIIAPALAGELDYPPQVSKWKKVPLPSNANRVSREIWSSAANDSRHDWRVFFRDGEVCAQLANEASELKAPRPAFKPAAETFEDGIAFASVDDGWLVGFNHGEFGAALYWFNHDGTENYRISRHQVVDFFKIKDDLYAIEGLAHMSLSRGSIIRIARSNETKTWQATVAVTLPFAPEAVSVTRAGLKLVTLSDTLISVDSQWKIKTILPNAPWKTLYPTSSVLSLDEKKLYIGMRQFVGEFNLASKKLRLLVPSEEFLNKLSPAEIESIRKTHTP